MSFHPAQFGGHSHFGSEVIMNLVCHVLLQDHVVKVPWDFMGGNSSWKVTTLASLVTIGTVVVEIMECEDIMFLVAKEENSRCSHFNPSLLFNFQMTWVESTRHIISLTPIMVTGAQSSNLTNSGK